MISKESSQTMRRRNIYRKQTIVSIAIIHVTVIPNENKNIVCQ